MRRASHKRKLQFPEEPRRTAPSERQTNSEEENAPHIGLSTSIMTETSTFHWDIEDLEVLSVKGHPTLPPCVESARFEVGGSLWYLQLTFPAEKFRTIESSPSSPGATTGSGFSDGFQVFLFREETPDSDIIARLKLHIPECRVQMSGLFRFIQHTSLGHGWESINFRSGGMNIPNKLQLRGSLQVYLAVESSVHVEQPPTVRAPSITGDLSTARRQEILTDAELVVEDRRFPVHRCVLAARSTVFRAMFESTMREGQDGVVNILDFPASTVEAMLKFVYTDVLDTSGELDVWSLLAAAGKYCLEGLQTRCETILAGELCVDTAVDTLIAADRHNMPLLRTEACRFVAHRLRKFNDADLARLSENPTIMQKILQQMPGRESQLWKLGIKSYVTSDTEEPSL